MACIRLSPESQSSQLLGGVQTSPAKDALVIGATEILQSLPMVGSMIPEIACRHPLQLFIRPEIRPNSTIQQLALP